MTNLWRALSTRDLIVYGLLFIGPTAPIGVYGVLADRSGGAIATVFVVATIAMAFTAWSYAQMAAEVPRAGSVSAYATAGLGRAPGFLAGWMVGLDYLFIPAVAALFTGIASHALVPAIPVWLGTAVAIIVSTALNLAGVRLAAQVGFVMVIVSCLLVAIFIVAAIVVLIHDGPRRDWLSPFLGAPSAILGAASIAVLSFLGFDAIAGFAEENTGEPRQIGRALLFCLVVAGVLFVIQSYLAALVDPQAPPHPNSGAAFYTLAREVIGGWFATAISAVKAVGPLFSALVAQAAVSRLIYGMATQGQLPQWLGRIHPRTKTPLVATLLSAVTTALLGLWAAQREDGLDLLSSLVTVGALSGFALLHTSVIALFFVRRRSRAWLSHLVIPLVGLAIVVVLLCSASRIAVIVGASWLVLGAVGATLIARRATR